MNNKQALTMQGYTPHETDLEVEAQDLIFTPSKEQGTGINNKGISKLYRSVSCTKAENDLPDDDFTAIQYDTLKEIQMNADVLLTDLPIDIHSHSIKTTFKNLKIIRICK